MIIFFRFSNVVVYCVALEYVKGIIFPQIPYILINWSCLFADRFDILFRFWHKQLQMRLDMFFQISDCPRKTDTNIAGDKLNCV